MGKINILVIPSDNKGVGRVRSFSPFTLLNEQFPDDVHVDIKMNPDYDNDNFFKQYDIIHIHKAPSNKFQEGANIIKKLQSLGCKINLDLDDHWKLDPKSNLYQMSKQHEWHKRIVENIKLADIVTVTTKYFADIVKKYNKNVYVLPNALNPTEKQFIPNGSPDNGRIKFGWIGGSSHLYDLQPIQGMVNRLLPYKDKIQMVLCGFDLRGKKIHIDPQTGEEKERQLEPKETVWYQYEKFFTDDYKLLEDDEIYMNHLLRFNYKEEFNDIDKPYRRVWTKAVNEYGESYNKYDISLAPLENNEFNSVKSQIKVIEAGLHKMPIIAQNIPPYQIDIEHGKNGFLIDEKKNHKNWFKYAKKFIDNPNLIQEMGEALNETVKDAYDLRNVNKDRLDLMKWLVGQ